MRPTTRIPSVERDLCTYERTLHEAHARFKNLTDGANADYIPELAKVPSELFGIAIATAAGAVYSAGDAGYAFAIESISKPFTLALVMQQVGGLQCIVDKIGVEPTGFPFNSILATQLFSAASVNPLCNAGALACVSLVNGLDGAQRFGSILQWFGQFAGVSLELMQNVYQSEVTTNPHNRALAYSLAASNRIYSDPMDTLDVFTRQASIGVTARQVAVMGATLANHGTNPVTRRPVVDPVHVPPILAMMSGTGLYERSGYWAVTVGLPAKSGVGGGLVAVAPGKLAVAAFSPRLDSAGNSVRAMKAVEYISAQLGLNIFAAGQRFARE